MTSKPLDHANAWIAIDCVPVPVERRGKRPMSFDGRLLPKWGELTKTTALAFFNGTAQNIGLLLGDASNKADVDLDCPEAIEVAPKFLPLTSNFGRESARKAHAVYDVVTPGATIKIKDPNRSSKGDKSTIVEYRANGSQTVVPGAPGLPPISVHESGELIEWENDLPFARATRDELVTAVGRIGAAVLFRRYLPSAPWRGPAAHALFGTLLTAGWDHDDAWAFVGAAAPDVDLDTDDAKASGGLAELAQRMGDEHGKRALAAALDALNIAHPTATKRTESTATPENEPAELAAIAIEKRAADAARYVRSIPLETSGDGSSQLIKLCALAVRGFALGAERGHEIVHANYVARLGLKWSQTRVWKSAQDAMKGPAGGAPLAWGCKLLEKIEDAGEQGGLRLLEDNRGVIDCTANVIAILGEHAEWKGVLQYDAFRETIAFTRTPPRRPSDAPSLRPHGTVWTEADDVRTQAWIVDAYGFEPSKGAIADAVSVVAEKQMVHPVRDYLRSLKWDGTTRLESMLPTYFGAAATSYAKGIGRLWMISGVARAFEPGCQVDYLLVLEGKQGVGKSSALGDLMPDPSWFSDTGITIGHKDSYQALHGKWLYIFDELDSIKGTELTKTKNFLTSRADNFRPPFARRNRDFQRQTFFAGTTNEKHYLRDRTGNRRFWPVECGRLDRDAIVRDRDQLWAEAVALYDHRAQWWPDHALTLECEAEQKERVVGDSWTEVVAAWLEGAAAEAIVAKRGGVLTHEVLSGALGFDLDRMDRAHEMRLADVLRELGWEPLKQKRDDTGRRVRRYAKVETGSDKGRDA